MPGSNTIQRYQHTSSSTRYHASFRPNRQTRMHEAVHPTFVPNRSWSTIDTSMIRGIAAYRISYLQRVFGIKVKTAMRGYVDSVKALLCLASDCQVPLSASSTASPRKDMHAMNVKPNSPMLCGMNQIFRPVTTVRQIPYQVVSQVVCNREVKSKWKLRNPASSHRKYV